LRKPVLNSKKSRSPNSRAKSPYKKQTKAFLFKKHRMKRLFKSLDLKNEYQPISLKNAKTKMIKRKPKKRRVKSKAKTSNLFHNDDISRSLNFENSKGSRNKFSSYNQLSFPYRRNKLKNKKVRPYTSDYKKVS
jgi:hypothetical protein